MKLLLKSFPTAALCCGAFLYAISGCSRAPEAPPKAIELHVDDKIKFDVSAFEVARGQKVTVTFKNVGNTPKFSMGHNFVLMDKSINEQNVSKFMDEASTHAASDYVPPKAKEVLAHSKLLGPGETDVVTFTAPFVPGDYLYLCSFPGHFTQGAKGIMTVK